MNTDNREVILRSTNTTYIKGLMKADGKLSLSNKFIIFNPFNDHALGPYKIELTDINLVEHYKLLPLISDGMRIKCSNGDKFIFVLSQPQSWIEQLQLIMLDL